MNDLQNKIYQLLQEMDSSEDTPEGVDKAHLPTKGVKPGAMHQSQPAKNDQSEIDKEANVEKSNKPVSHKKEKFLTLSSKPITLGKRSSGTPQEIEEKPEIENLLHIVETESIKDKE